VNNCDSTAPGPGALVAFCKQISAKQASEWPPSEETLAREFVEYFNLEPMVFLGELQRLCESSGIVLRIAPLPTSLRGFNHRYQNKREILISGTQVLTREHTALHELRELLEYEFCDLNKPICTNETREKRAEQFAISVRISAFEKEVPKLVDQIATIESKWPRRAAYALLFVFGAMHLMSLALSPRLEDVMEENLNKQRRFQNN